MLIPYVAWLGSFALFDWLLRGAGGFGDMAALILSVMVWMWLDRKMARNRDKRMTR